MRLSLEAWQDARAHWEAGNTGRATAAQFGCSRQAVDKRAIREGWRRDCEGFIRNRVTLKIARFGATKSPEKRFAAIEREADNRARVAVRHMALVEQAVALQQQAIGELPDGSFAPDVDVQRSARLNASTINELISLERKIHKLEDAPPPAATQTIIFAMYDD